MFWFTKPRRRMTETPAKEDALVVVLDLIVVPHDRGQSPAKRRDSVRCCLLQLDTPQLPRKRMGVGIQNSPSRRRLSATTISTTAYGRPDDGPSCQEPRNLVVVLNADCKLSPRWCSKSG
jgi:hypothetical protein